MNPRAFCECGHTAHPDGLCDECARLGGKRDCRRGYEEAEAAERSQHERDAERGRAARREVERRVCAAIDRLDVALQFSRPGSSTVAQILHGIHYLGRGWADSHGQQSIPPEAPDFRLSDTEAEELAVGLTRMIELARNARSTWGEQE